MTDDPYAASTADIVSAQKKENFFSQPNRFTAACLSCGVLLLIVFFTLLEAEASTSGWVVAFFDFDFLPAFWVLLPQIK
jgi:hypothetical protein